MIMKELPSELLEEILFRLPTQTIETCVRVSPACAALVRRSSFHREYYRRSSSIRDYHALLVKRVNSNWIFSSVSVLAEEPRPLFLSSTNLPYKNDEFLSYACGLLCSGFGSSPILSNPSNGISLILPDAFFTRETDKVRSFLGYSYETGFKVVALAKDSCKVLSLDPMIWRSLNSSPHLKPERSSICIDGTIYYAAFLKPSIICLISFNLQTESFYLNKIPQSPKLGMFFLEKLLNVNGNVGVSFSAGCDKHMIRVLEDGEQDLWSERLLEAPDSILIDIEKSSQLAFEGFTKYGDTVFSQQMASTKVVYYWDGGSNFRKNIFPGFSSTKIILDHLNTTIFG